MKGPLLQLQSQGCKNGNYISKILKILM